MIKRYSPKRIARIWTLWMKFKMWLAVELAVIDVRCAMGIYPADVGKRIRKLAKFKVKDIIELDKKIEHDLIAFVETVRQSLPPELRKYIHDGMTSYDTEEPALALQIQKAGMIILEELEQFIYTIRVVASMHMWTYCMGITHTQDAQPTTFGWRLCMYLEMMERAKKNLSFVLEQVKESKLSGAVGNYNTIDPELEVSVLKKLGLRVRAAASQITQRDVIARFLNEIAVIGSAIEKMAVDIRLLSQTAVWEVVEPRKPGQKGSSAMPHKKNPILSERMAGMARLLRAWAHAAVENVATWLERDISQSSVERVILPDSTSLIVYMLQKMTGIISRLEVNRDIMRENIYRTHGCWASEKVKLYLCDQGIDTEAVYLFVQQCAFRAFEEKRSFKAVLLSSKLPKRRKTVAELFGQNCLNHCFDYRRPLRQNLPAAYERNGLDTALALPPN